MARLSQRVYNQRLSLLDSSKSSFGTTAKSSCAGLFLVLGVLGGISAYYSYSDVLAQFLIAGVAIAFLLVSVFAILERNCASTIGYCSIAFLVIVMFINYINTGSVGIGFIWLFTILFAIKNLFEFDQFLAQKRSKKTL